MKKLPLIVFAVVLFACSKSNSPDPNPPVNPTGLVIAMRIDQPQNDHILKDTFRYDANNSLVSFSTLSLNGVSGGNPTADSGTYYFTVDPDTYLPTGYTFVFRKPFYNVDYTGRHLLYYDNQQRVIKDSVVEILSGPDEYKTVSYYTYSANALRVGTAYNGGTDITVLDSLLFTNDNITGKSEYNWNSANSEFELSYRWPDFINTGKPNPYYHTESAPTIGLFLDYIGVGDYYSKQLLVNTNETFVWTTNADGKVVSGVGSAGTTINYTYKQ